MSSGMCYCWKMMDLGFTSCASATSHYQVIEYLTLIARPVPSLLR